MDVLAKQGSASRQEARRLLKDTEGLVAKLDTCLIISVQVHDRSVEVVGGRDGDT